MTSLANIPAVTVMPAAGRWGEADCTRAREDIEAKERDRDGWRRVERNELITGSLNTIAGFACGRTIAKIIDPDDTWSSSRNDGSDEKFELGDAILFILYMIICLNVVGCGIYYLFGKVDAAQEAHDRIRRKIEQKQLTGTSSVGSHADARAHELGSKVSHNVRTSVLTGIINKWSSTQMFTVAVLLHHLYDWTPSSEDAPQNAWDALFWLVAIALVLIIAFYELPVRISARFGVAINLARLERVVDVGAGALAWLVAVFFMEALEITAAHRTMKSENLKHVHYYSSAYHGFPVTLRTAVCLGTFFATGLVLFSLQQIAKRADEKRRLCFCCQRCHPDDDYIRQATKSDLEKRPRAKLRRDLATKIYFLGQHGHRVLGTTQRTFTNISSIALQRLIMGLVTFADYDVADDFALQGKSATETAQDFAGTVTDIVSPDPVPEPEPEPQFDDSSSGSWFAEENITEAISPLLAACEQALSTNNATLLYNSIRSTRQGLSIDGKVVKEVDPEPEPLPEPEPEPEPPPELDEATTVSKLKSSTWTDCYGDSQQLVCSVVPRLAEPQGGPSWVEAQCDNTVAVVCDVDTCDEPSFFHTGAMDQPFCNNMPLYGDYILLAIFAVLCSVVALSILRASETSLRQRLSEAIKQTEEKMSLQAERSRNLDANPMMPDGRDGASQRVTFSIDAQLMIQQTRYDYMTMLTQQQRSFCQWIVNKTWWDVIYNTMKHLNLLSNYYLTAIVLTGVAALGPLILYDTSLVQTACCGRDARAVEGIKRGLLFRSISRERAGSKDSEYSSLDRSKDDDDVVDSEKDRLVSSESAMDQAIGDGAGEPLVSIDGMLSGPTADESDGEFTRREELLELRQHNRRLQERVAQLEREVAAGRLGSAPGGGVDVARDLL